jgi:hypothetical protein
MQALLADFILIVHLLFVAFVVGGLAFIWVGAWHGWQAVRNFKFRIAHLAAIVFVAAQTLLGFACPLTVWEDELRDSPAGIGFLERWLHAVLYYDLPKWVFGLVYVLFALIVALTYLAVPPARTHKRR